MPVLLTFYFLHGKVFLCAIRHDLSCTLPMLTPSCIIFFWHYRLFIGLVVLSAPHWGTAWAMAPEAARQRMVAEQIKARGIGDARVLKAMQTVPRHRFVPASLQDDAYDDRPLPIGEGQTISQPYIVALMTERLQLKGNERVLEIGTGSGYQAAVLAQMATDVFSIEIKPKLYEKSQKILQSLNIENVYTRLGDGYFGWPESAPFDAIMITAAVDHIPPPLLQQLKEGGRLVLPLGNPFGYQNLVLVTRTGQDYQVKQITGVLFVPMTGAALKD